MTPVLYTIENNSNQIFLEMGVSTAYGALITAGVDLFINGKKYPKEQFAGNDIDSKFLIGTASELKNGLLVADFVINLKFVDSDLWEECFENLEIAYSLSGGVADKTFSHEKQDLKFKSNSGRIIQTDKRFFFKMVSL